MNDAIPQLDEMPGQAFWQSDFQSPRRLEKGAKSASPPDYHVGNSLVATLFNAIAYSLPDCHL